MSRRIVMVLLLALTASAHAQPAPAPAPAGPPDAKPIEVSRFQLIKGIVPVPGPGKPADTKIDECELIGKAGTPPYWDFDEKADSCRPLVNLTASIDAGPFKLKLSKPTSISATYELNADGSVSITVEQSLLALAITSAGERRFVDVEVKDNEIASSPDVTDWFTRLPPETWAKGEGETLYLVTWKKPSERSPRAKSTLGWCDAERKKWPKHKAICVDGSSGQLDTIHIGLDQHMLPPNQAVVVIVQRVSNQRVDVEMDGVAALFEPSVDNLASASSQQGEGTKRSASYETVVHTFGPRAPGADADVHIELRDSKNELLDKRTIELVVPTTYAGAIRLGFALIRGGAVDRAYAARTAPGSQHEEITATASGKGDIEVTVGMSAYVFDVLVYGGRRYIGRPKASYVVPSPYIAVGAVAPEAAGGGARPITSLHIGAEWELSKSFAVSLTGVYRRVTRLNGHSVGEPVATTDSFTDQHYEWGWAVVFSVSPEFMQLARGNQ